jgi:hypothetical protein
MRAGILVVLVALLPLVAISSCAQPTLKIVAFDGSELSGARIRVTTLDGRVFNFTLDPRSPFIVRDVVRGVLMVEVVSWKNVPVGYRQNVTVYSDRVLTVPSIGKLTLRVTGSRGQPLSGASVRISYGAETVEEGATGASGIYSTLLPQATYQVTVEYGGRGVSRTILVQPSRENVVEVSLDVFVSFAGVDLSLSEFLGLAVLAILLVLGIVILLIEYTNWRARRARVVLAKPT